jgi:CheY-like chemotaxis protein
MPSVLVIDDEASVRKVLRKALEREGYKVMDAANGSEGIALYQEHPTDLVVTDILMPEKEGLETIMAFRRDFPEVRIFAMSGGGLIGSVCCLSMAKGLGATRVYTKPLGIEELLKDIGELLNNAE